ncbi:hypothetical protein [Rouxiella sp. Mn2063]|uniref:hypothetical protein n=1 Tax=Rouxiella sp. Mn2063 TaxID=3395262 RepID=UPI003BBB3183
MPIVGDLSSKIVEVIKGKQKNLYVIYMDKFGKEAIAFEADIEFIACDISDDKAKDFIEKTRLIHTLETGVGKSELAKILEEVVKMYISKIPRDKIKKSSLLLDEIAYNQVNNMISMNSVTSFFSKKIIPKFF